METENRTCIIIGASQAGVSCAFALREEGWAGRILLYDTDPKLPYYRPPLSKTALTGEELMYNHILKPLELYRKENIQLGLGIKVVALDALNKEVILSDHTQVNYDRLVLATGARPFIPNIEGIQTAAQVFVLRTQQDAEAIRHALERNNFV